MIVVVFMSDNKLYLKMIDVPCPCCGEKDYKEYAHGYDYIYQTSADKFKFVRCNNCSVLFLNPRPAPTELDIIYPPEFTIYHRDKKTITHTIINFLLSRRASYLTKMLGDRAKILDAGCGNTVFLDCLKKISKEWDLYGNDIDINTCDKISAAGYTSLCGKFEELILAENFFDMIFFKHIIEHLDNPRAALSKAFLILKSGGELVIETPNFDSLDARIFRSGTWEGYHFPRHWTIFNAQTITNLGEKEGFKVKSVDFLTNPFFWIQSVHNLLKSKGFPSWVVNFFKTPNFISLSFATILDLIQKFFIRKTSIMRIVFYKENQIS